MLNCRGYLTGACTDFQALCRYVVVHAQTVTGDVHVRFRLLPDIHFGPELRKLRQTAPDSNTITSSQEITSAVIVLTGRVEPFVLRHFRDMCAGVRARLREPEVLIRVPGNLADGFDLPPNLFCGIADLVSHRKSCLG